MGDLGGAAQAGASVIDTAATDATNVALQHSAQDFQGSQAAIQRNWSAQQAALQNRFSAGQAALNRTFQDTEQTKAEAYNTEMSNTAVQRRAQDIQKAGFNPLLAVSQLGGASTPSMSAPSGSVGSPSMPSGAAAAGVPPARVSGVMPGLIDALNSQAQRGAVNAQADLNQSQADLNKAKLPYASQQAAADVDQTRTQVQTLITQQNKNMSDVDINSATIDNLVQDKNFKAQLQSGLLQLQALDVQLKRNGVREGAATADVMDSALGRVLIAGGLGHQAAGDIGGAAAMLEYKIEHGLKIGSALTKPIGGPGGFLTNPTAPGNFVENFGDPETGMTTQ